MKKVLIKLAVWILNKYLFDGNLFYSYNGIEAGQDYDFGHEKGGYDYKIYLFLRSLNYKNEYKYNALCRVYSGSNATLEDKEYFISILKESAFNLEKEVSKPKLIAELDYEKQVIKLHHLRNEDFSNIPDLTPTDKKIKIQRLKEKNNV